MRNLTLTVITMIYLSFVPAHAAGGFPLASCNSWNGTILKKSGVNSSAAIIEGTVTKDDIFEYCERDPGGEIGKITLAQCVEKYLQRERGIRLVSFANCESGHLRFVRGNKDLVEVRFPLDITAESSCSSGLPPLIEQFKILCPLRAKQLLPHHIISAGSQSAIHKNTQEDSSAIALGCYESECRFLVLGANVKRQVVGNGTEKVMVLSARVDTIDSGEDTIDHDTTYSRRRAQLHSNLEILAVCSTQRPLLVLSDGKDPTGTARAYPISAFFGDGDGAQEGANEGLYMAMCHPELAKWTKERLGKLALLGYGIHLHPSKYNAEKVYGFDKDMDKPHPISYIIYRISSTICSANKC